MRPLWLAWSWSASFVSMSSPLHHSARRLTAVRRREQTRTETSSLPIPTDGLGTKCRPQSDSKGSCNTPDHSTTAAIGLPRNQDRCLLASQSIDNNLLTTSSIPAFLLRETSGNPGKNSPESPEITIDRPIAWIYSQHSHPLRAGCALCPGVPKRHFQHPTFNRGSADAMSAFSRPLGRTQEDTGLLRRKLHTQCEMASIANRRVPQSF